MWRRERGVITDNIGWEKSFVVTYENNKIIGVLGFDVDEVKKCAEIWGPFIKAENWEEVALHMWKELIEKVPFHIEKFYGFIMWKIIIVPV